MNITQLYNDLILKKTELVILDCIGRISTGNYDYKFKYHSLEKDTIEKIAQILIDDIIFYSYSASEIERQGLLDNGLRSAAAYALSERLAKRSNYKSDGLVGELMLDILIQAMHPNIEKLFTRAKYKQFADNSEITGYDAAFFLKTKESKIELWLGQAKAGDEPYCKRDICNDLNNKFLDRYFCDVIRYMKDRGFNETTDGDLLKLLNEINRTIFDAMHIEGGINKKDYLSEHIFEILERNDVTITVPCLLMYNSDVYKDLDTFNTKIEEQCDKIFKYFESKQFTYTSKIPIRIIFINLPIQDLNNIKQKIAVFKQGVQ